MSTPYRNQLPGLAGEIEQVIGLELAVRLLKARGGTEISIPRNAEHTDMARLIGVKATQMLAKELKPGRITLPCGHMRGRDAERNAKHAQAMAMIGEGASSQKIALACDLHIRTVLRYRRSAGVSDSQGKLPL